MSLESFRFSPSALTKLVAASSSTGVAATQVCTGGEQGMFLSNPSTVALYVSIGSSAVQASMPSTAAPSAGLCLPPSAYRTFSNPGSNSFGWLSAVTSAGAAAPGLFATPGFGQ